MWEFDKSPLNKFNLPITLVVTLLAATTLKEEVSPLRWARKRQRRPQVALDDVAELSVGPAPGDPMLGGMLRRLIATLPETPRMAMILRYQEDLDPAEIAETMGIPLGTVKSHIQRSLALLREKLERRGVGER